MRFFDNSLQDILTYFLYDFEDLQVSKIVAQTSLNQNVGLATNQFLLEPRTYGVTVGYNF